jgi:hypothetical protein
VNKVQYDRLVALRRTLDAPNHGSVIMKSLALAQLVGAMGDRISVGAVDGSILPCTVVLKDPRHFYGNS